jgi:hypothetical protein
MPELSLGQAVDRAIEDAMARDERIILIGEDAPLLRAPLFARFGAERVIAAPISELAFFGAAAGAAMAGLRPIVELYMVDFIAVAYDAVLNDIAKLGRARSERRGLWRWRPTRAISLGQPGIDSGSVGGRPFDARRRLRFDDRGPQPRWSGDLHGAKAPF